MRPKRTYNKQKLKLQIAQAKSNYQFSIEDYDNKKQNLKLDLRKPTVVVVKGNAKDTSIAVKGETPLYIVDGKEIKNINEISPNDIEKIDVLKGVSATKLYGKKGAKGVVVITTKKNAKASKDNKDQKEVTVTVRTQEGRILKNDKEDKKENEKTFGRR